MKKWYFIEMNVFILCKVIDNFGDIGFVYRLTRQLLQIEKNISLTLVVSNLESFSFIEKKINPSLKKQTVDLGYGKFNLLEWESEAECEEYIKQNKVELVLECFQCSRPLWLEKYLNDTQRKHTVKIINIDYLTAEDWAEDFHLLKSGTRFINTKKINFMPGFTNKTGGLVLDNEFMQNLEEENGKQNAIEKIKTSIPQIENYVQENNFNILIFTYEMDFSPYANAIEDFYKIQKQKNSQFKINLFLAKGVGFESVKTALQKINAAQNKINMIELPGLNQIVWDSLLCVTDFNIIRGEDSFARACLSGVPFVWNAYVQENEFQLVKVDAFLKLTEKFFEPEESKLIREVSILLNRTKNKAGKEAGEILENVSEEKSAGQLFCSLLCEAKKIKSAFKKFSLSLISNGDLARNLLDASLSL